MKGRRNRGNEGGMEIVKEGKEEARETRKEEEMRGERKKEVNEARRNDGRK